MIKISPIESNIEIVYKPEMYGVTPHFNRALGGNRVYRFDRKARTMEFITYIPWGSPLIAVTEEQYKNWKKSIIISVPSMHDTF